jgi:hypothetical protein
MAARTKKDMKKQSARKPAAKAAPVQKPQTEPIANAPVAQEPETKPEKSDFYATLTALRERKRLALIASRLALIEGLREGQAHKIGQPPKRNEAMINELKRAALYVRASTDKQTVQNQIAALTAVAEARGWTIVETYSDAGIGGAKDRKDRPGLDQMLNDASRRKFDVVMAWAIDRLGRSLIDLLGTIETLEACGVDLYLDQQSIDTTTPAGKLMFSVVGAFAAFERAMIQQRVHAGLDRAGKHG